ncbi:MAG: NAD(P)/FAD-dependent oxidoreductase [Chloroflexi bacterium]|nr:NAD(P)/FAD-dependent oxidoreductase [Chloroflexota bacterium]
MRDVDVIVIGAGPCGNMAALELARRGVSVAVLDWRTRIGDKLCTGIIGRECAELFAPAAEHIHGEARSATIVSPAGRHYRIERATTQAYIVNRVSYVNAVAEQAQHAGAEYILDSRVTDIRTAGTHAKVYAVGGSTRREYTCRIVILASGFGSPLLRMVGLDGNKKTAGNRKTSDCRRDNCRDNGSANVEYLVGYQVEAIASDLHETEVYLGSGTAQDSFAWLVPLSGNRALVGMAPRRRANGQMGAFIDRLRLEGRIDELAGEQKAWGIPIRPLSPSYADRALVAGDAAGLVKPTTGGGIYYAFLSGRIAAEAAQTAIARRKYAANDLRGYERQWKAVFGRELRIGYYARLLYETLGDEQIERLLDAFLSDGDIAEYIGEDVAFDWHSKVILKVLRHTGIRRALATLGPSAAPFVARLLQARG